MPGPHVKPQVAVVIGQVDLFVAPSLKTPAFFSGKAFANSSIAFSIFISLAWLSGPVGADARMAKTLPLLSNRRACRL